MDRAEPASIGTAGRGRLSGGVRLALVTGTTSGIGEAVARELLDRGWRVVGLARRASPMEHDAYAHMQLDLGDLSTLTDGVETSLVERVANPALARLALVNNAADPGLLGPVERVDPAAMLRAFAVNVVAPTWLMGWMVRRSDPAVPVRIVNLSSGAGKSPYPGLATYGSSKAALRLASMVFAAELASEVQPDEVCRDVTILSYGPGPVDTPMQAMARAAPAEMFPLHETFTRWAAEGQLMSPAGPATEIATYLETDGYPGFAECRSGQLQGPGSTGSRSTT